MQFEKTQTFKNLARSFAGESQAGMRYQLIAKQAMQEGYKTLADEIRTIAKNETFHAKRFFETLQEKAGSRENIDIEAGYPFHAGSLEEGLAFAANDEKRRLCRYCGALQADRESRRFSPDRFRLSCRRGKKRHAVFRGFARTLGMRRLRTHGRRRKSMENLPALRRGTGARNVASAFRRQPRLTGRIFAYLADSILKGE